MDNIFKVSVIVCVFNEENCILRALKSLRANEIYSATEVIIIDDCSTNPITIKILARLEKFTNIKLIRSETNLGLSNSRNLGFGSATTEIILPLDADDELPKGTLDLVYKTFKENTHIDFVVGDYYLNNVDTNETERVDCSTLAEDNIVNAKKLVSHWKLLGTSPCKKSVWESIGGYNLEFSYSVQDVEFWMRAITKGFTGLYINYPIYKWHKSADGMSMNFDRYDMTKLADQQEDFYLLNWKKKDLYNKIFEGYYPYKQKDVLLPFGKKSFFHLSIKNKLRFIAYSISKLF